LYLGYRPRFGQEAIDRLSVPVTHSQVAPPNTTSFDWRNIPSVITPMKDQGACGSCWAFSAISEVESMWALAGKSKTLTQLSAQQVVSCDKGGEDYGCFGGDTVTAYKYIMKDGVGGLETERDYPYTSGKSGVDGPCMFKQEKVFAKMTGFTYATPPCFGSCIGQNETLLANNLATVGPVSICVAASSWMDYKSGILSDNCPFGYTTLDHCVHLVGYQTNEKGVKYWLVKNQWGEDWGQKGYIWIQFGKNLCGIADEATFVTITPHPEQH